MVPLSASAWWRMILIMHQLYKKPRFVSTMPPGRLKTCAGSDVARIVQFHRGFMNLIVMRTLSAIAAYLARSVCVANTYYAAIGSWYRPLQ